MVNNLILPQLVGYSVYIQTQSCSERCYIVERQANVSRKGRRLAKKREDYFFVVEEILKNWNIVLKDWNKKEIEDKSVPPQQLKKIYLDEMRMGDFEKSFKRCKIEESSGETENMITSDTKSISPTTTQTTTLTTKLIRVLTDGIHNDGEDAESISQTTTQTTTLTTTLITILTDGIHNDGEDANTGCWEQMCTQLQPWLLAQITTSKRSMVKIPQLQHQLQMKMRGNVRLFSWILTQLQVIRVEIQ